jgi:hypothetical protein
LIVKMWTSRGQSAVSLDRLPFRCRPAPGRLPLSAKKVAMPNREPLSPQNEAGANGILLERVRARVQSASHAIQRRDTGTLPHAAASAPASDASSDAPAVGPLPRELRALYVVYRTLGRTHRRYRERTGKHTPPALKEAARAFKREPSVLSLVPVAGFLDDLGLLTW